MFETSYRVTALTRIKKPGTKPHVLHERLFKFKTEQGGVYLILVEVYEFDVAVLKFYRQRDENYKNKFNTVLEDSEHQSIRVVSKILRTVVNVALWVYKKDNYTSFAFQGAPKLKGGVKEDLVLTQRFRIYDYITNQLFGSRSFEHRKAKGSSYYMMVSKLNSDYVIHGNKIERAFAEWFEELDFLQ
ncbi:MAG: hypothetical protein WBB45_13465 [Cyclobacteriaceae bacterium]